MSGASVDLRGFVFSFEGLLRKYQWELDALQGRMGAAHADVKNMTDSLETLQVALGTHGMDVSHAMTKSLDPFFHQRSIRYLVESRTVIAAQKMQLALLKQMQEQLREACLEKQRKIEMLNNYQEQQMQDYVLAEQTRLANESDRDWSSRNISRARAVKISTINSNIEGRPS